jgi:hypothetical protein
VRVQTGLGKDYSLAAQKNMAGKKTSGGLSKKSAQGQNNLPLPQLSIARQVNLPLHLPSGHLHPIQTR